MLIFMPIIPITKNADFGIDQPGFIPWRGFSG